MPFNTQPKLSLKLCILQNWIRSLCLDNTKVQVDLLRNKNLGPGRIQILSRTPSSAPSGISTLTNHLVSLWSFSSRVWCELTVHVQLEKDIKHQGVLLHWHQKLDCEPGSLNQEIHKSNKSVLSIFSFCTFYVHFQDEFSLLWELDS